VESFSAGRRKKKKITGNMTASEGGKKGGLVNFAREEGANGPSPISWEGKRGKGLIKALKTITEKEGVLKKENLGGKARKTA